MKNRSILKKLFSILLAAVMLVGTIPFVGVSAAAQNTDASSDQSYRVLLSSDMHYSIDAYMAKYYGVTNDDRLQLWVDSIKAEHENDPIDLLIIPGDVSFDHCDSRGTVTKGAGSTVQSFVDNYVSQLPEEIDVFIMPGNHDAWTNANWVAKTGYNREGYLTLGDNLFIMIDTYDNPAAMEDNYGTGANMTYQKIDVDWVQDVMDQYPTHKVWLVSHYFDPTAESTAFKNLVCNNDRVMGLFAGHTHQSELIELGAAYGNKVIAQTGTFSYSYYTTYSGTQQQILDSLWGYRELVITPDIAYSQYILVDTTNTNLTSPAIKQSRRTAHRIEYVEPVTATENWYDADAKTLYVDSLSDLFAFSRDCTAANDYLDGKTVVLKRDIDMRGYDWTQIAEFRGTLDGQGFAIKNLTMSGTSSVAFINKLVDATVQNIRFVGGELSASSTDVATVAISVTGTCYFENVYTETTLKLTAASAYRAGGMLSFINANDSTAVFQNCVSNCTFSGGSRAGGFVAQINVNSNAEFIDCAFIGDMSNAGYRSSAIAGYTTGSATLTRCVSLGKGSLNSDSGLLVYLDDANSRYKSGTRYTGDKNQYYDVDSVIRITDCYAASDAIYPVGLENGTQKRREGYDFTLNYNGQDTYHLDPIRLNSAEDSKDGLLQFENANPDNMYLAKGTTKNLTRENFATKYSALANAGWVLVDGATVAYGTSNGMTLPLILPKNVAKLLDGRFNTPVTSSYWHTKDNGTSYDIRFVSKVNFDDLTEYKRVGFEVSVKVKGQSTYLVEREQLSTGTVLTSINAGGTSIAATELGAEYIYALQIKGFQKDTEYEITLVSFAEMPDGTVIYNYGNELTLNVKNGATA